MKTILLDTNAYAALFEDEKAPLLDALASAETVWMSTIVLGELYAGFRAGSKYGKNAADLQEFMGGSTVRVAEVTSETSEIFGEVKHALKKRGTPIPMNDIWIASQCMELGSVLVTYDGHFKNVAGLRIW